MVGIDRKRVRQAFHGQAREYDKYAEVQKRVVSRLHDLASSVAAVPRSILDVGAGTGKLLNALTETFPAAAFVGIDLALGMASTARQNLPASVQVVNADAEMIPIRDSSFDLVVSTSTYQWLESLGVAFAEAHRVLVSGSPFVFALFGEKTLHELRASYGWAYAAEGKGEEHRTHTFFTLEQVGRALQDAGFRDCHCFSELEVENHGDVPNLLRSLKRVGAGNHAAGSGGGLAPRRVMLAMIERYQREYGKDGSIPATYEVIYGVGRRG